MSCGRSREPEEAEKPESLELERERLKGRSTIGSGLSAVVNELRDELKELKHESAQREDIFYTVLHGKDIALAKAEKSLEEKGLEIIELQGELARERLKSPTFLERDEMEGQIRRLQESVERWKKAAYKREQDNLKEVCDEIDRTILEAGSYVKPFFDTDNLSSHLSYLALGNDTVLGDDMRIVKVHPKDMAVCNDKKSQAFAVECLARVARDRLKMQKKVKKLKKQVEAKALNKDLLLTHFALTAAAMQFILAQTAETRKQINKSTPDQLFELENCILAMNIAREKLS